MRRLGGADYERSTVGDLMSRFRKRARRTPAVRRIGIPALRTIRRAQPMAGPRRLLNSIPKAGTHLAERVLHLHPETKFSAVHLVPDDFAEGLATTAGEAPLPDKDRLERAILRCAPGQYMTGHWPWDPQLHALLRKHLMGFAFVVRDPRDLVVSHVDYVTKRPDHFLHARYRSFETDEDRLLTTIRGCPPVGEWRGLVPLSRRLEDFIGWVEVGSSIIRFEDLVGPQGGGTLERQRTSIRTLLEALELDASPALLDRIAATLWDPGSMTFSSGTVGRWRTRFTKPVTAAFGECAGSWMSALGYDD